MARKTTSGLTERESEIMEFLWEAGPSSSEKVRKNLSGSPHDSSVRTLLRILVDKGFVKSDSRKRPAKYSAIVKKDKAQRRAVSDLLSRMFGGSAETLVLRLLEDKQLSIEQIEEIKKSVTEGKKVHKS